MDNTKVNDVIACENFIKGYYSDIEKLREELRVQNQMLKDALENDAEYADITAQIQDLQKTKKAIKDKLQQEPSLALIQEKVKDIKAEIKEGQMALFDYLEKWVASTGLTSIEINGDMKKIIKDYKLQSSE